MKRFTLLVATTLISSSAFCEVLSPDAALSRAMSSTTTSARHIKANAKTKPMLAKTITAGIEPAVYLYSRGSDNGFLVLSADDATDAVLGYCDNGTFDADNMPPAMTAWLNSYADQIAFIRKNPECQNVSRAKKDRDPIDPLCKTYWAQNSPYNNECPEVKVNGTYTATPTGCTATCLAQVLKYFNYPKQGEGEYSYKWSSGGEELSFDFDSYEFQWDRMLDVYTAKTNLTYVDDVAQLMYACGVVVNMDYKSSGSGAYPIKLLETGPKYLLLDKGIRYHSRDYYTVDEWNDLIYDNIKNVGPVMYGGCIISSSSYAHEFVCDGYMADDLFHINWGWGKDYATDYNGYFRLSALDNARAGFTSSSYCYNYYQDAVCGIQPPVEGSSMYEQMYCTNSMSISSSSAALGSTIQVTVGLSNFSAETVTGTAGLKICDLQGNLISYVGTSKFNNIVIQGSLNSYKVTLPTDLADGTYTITPAFKLDGSDWKDARTKVANVRSYTMTVKNNTATFTADSTPKLSVADFSLDTPLYIDNTKFEFFGVSAKITNSNSAEYSGKVALALVSKDSNGNRTKVATSYYVPLFVRAGETLDFEYCDHFVEGTAAGGETYEVALVDGSGSYISDFVEVTISSGSSTYKITVQDVTADNSDSVDKHQIRIHFTTNCVSGYYNHGVYALVYTYNNGSVGSSSLLARSTDVLTIPEGKSKDAEIHFTIDDAVVGNSYRAYFLDYDENWIKTPEDVYASVTFTIGDESAVNDIASDETQIISTQYYNLQGVRLGNNVTAPGLYIKVDTDANGAKHTSRLLIK